jgi:hypothetical protein
MSKYRKPYKRIKVQKFHRVKILNYQIKTHKK